MSKLNFSGHETFQCRELWLKKGFDFVNTKKSFHDPYAVVELGVGKNMVNAIQYWMIAFALMDPEKKLSDLANYIFGPEGKDPFLEDSVTLWLLHYHLIKKEHSSIYSLFFNEFRKERPEFTRTHLVNYLKRKCEENRSVISENTIAKDAGVFLSTYLNPTRGQKDFKDLLAGLFIDLDLIERIHRIEAGGFEWYRIINREYEDIPAEISLYCILDNEDYGSSVSFHTLLTGWNSIGSVFALNANGLAKKIKEITQKYKTVIYTDYAGVKELQFKEKTDKWKVLDDCYGKSE